MNAYENAASTPCAAANCTDAFGVPSIAAANIGQPSGNRARIPAGSIENIPASPFFDGRATAICTAAKIHATDSSRS